MRIGVPKEVFPGEKRVALTPGNARQLRKLGYEISVEAGAGRNADIMDDAYRAADVDVVDDFKSIWAAADIVIKVRPPEIHPDSGIYETELLKPGAILISLLWPSQNGSLLTLLAERGATAFAMDLVPRISRAQKMDVLSSMANISGYRAVIEASNHFGRFFTGQVTAAGRISPAKVLVIGAGVAGLAAIGAAQALGAIVRAFDVRPEVAEQIESMGAEFLLLDFDEDGSGDGGYAKPSSPEFREKQLALFREQAPDVDVVITTALIPGAEAPKLWLADMVATMKPGSVIVDLAAERGGNCELTIPDHKTVTDNGVSVIGYTDFPSRMAQQASELYATNIRHFIHEHTPKPDGRLVVNMDNVVTRTTAAVTDGEITFPPPPLPAPNSVRVNPQVPKNDPAAERIKAARDQRKAAVLQLLGLPLGAALFMWMGAYAPASFMQHLIVFVLACFVGYQVIWSVAAALHTPLMAVTNAISGIIIVGAILQVDSSSRIVVALAGISVLIAMVNICGGFLVTQRMLAMFRKS